ncbi:hypothetical protein ACFVH9_31300 [Streptomyces hirsutus]|uniref:hypothetical protein n=1 Tax=Streptomyces hirsutus TaxID=35620 RepID=UPI0036424835
MSRSSQATRASELFTRSYEYESPVPSRASRTARRSVSTSNISGTSGCLAERHRAMSSSPCARRPRA